MNSTSRSERYNARLGLGLFTAYSLFYLAFTLVNAFRQDVAQMQLLRGINLTTWWGLALILVAFLLAMVYGLMCKQEAAPAPNDREDTKS